MLYLLKRCCWIMQLSPKKIKKSLYGSGILQESDKCIKSQITAQEEGIFPAIRQKLGLPFVIKSYFVVAQLHETYVQATLHRVVNITLHEENISAIVVQDEIIPIENSNDELCENIWRYMNSDGNISYCDLHGHELNANFDLFLLQNYSNFMKKLKRIVCETVSVFKNIYYLFIV